MPDENLDFRGDACPPDPLEFGGGGPSNKFTIKGFNREAARGGVGPDNRVFLLREQREESNKTLLVFQLCRRERTMQSKVPIIRRELRD